MSGLGDRLKGTARRIPWWGISALVHALVAYILMNWEVEARRPLDIIEGIRIAAILPPLPEPKPLPRDVSTFEAPDPPAIEPPIERPDMKEVVDKQALDAAQQLAATPVIGVDADNIFSRRTGAGREAAIKAGQGTEQSENAVEAGLVWLARKQLATGGWSTGNEGTRWADPGISGLATLAFLSAGYTHRRGKFIRTVDRALAYLKTQQDREGCIALTEDGKRGGGYMYCHPLGTLALVEAYGMTKDPLLQEPAQRAVDFIVKTQNTTGGWRYYAKSSDGDSSISGWMVMALRSASLSELDVPPKTFDEARRFFDSVTNKAEGTTYYLPSKLPMGMALHAVGMLSHQYLGMAANDPYLDRAAAFINANPPKWIDRDTPTAIPLDKLALFTATNNYYYWYYANLALHQRQCPAWEKWHPQVRDLLVKIQERGGDLDGSWPPQTYGGTTGGRVFSTALAILTLEVYYRYATPSYRQAVDELLAAYGDALAAYNHFVRLDREKESGAEDARKGAIARLERFLALTESRGEDKDPARTDERRGQATLMLVRLHRAGGELDEAIAILKALPARFPKLMDTAELVWALADLHRARAQQLTEAGDLLEARKAKAAAVNLYWPIVSKAIGKRPELELWLANAFFEREDWQKAHELYKAQLDRANLRRLDPKSEPGKVALALLDRLIKCSTNLKMHKSAERYLDQLEKFAGTSLAIRRQRAELCRLREDYAGARKIYHDILLRVPEHGKEWWETKYEQLFMAWLEGHGEFVVKSIGRLQISHPELGGEDLKARFLDLLSRAQNGAAPGKALPESPGR